MNRTIQTAEKEHFSAMARQMSKWVDQVFGHGYQKFCPGETWQPAVNVYEGDDHICVVAELAGVSIKDIELTVQDNVLALTGYRQAAGLTEANRGARLHLMEIDHGRFCRRLELPDRADVENISATFRNGYLWIKIPRKGA